MVLIAKDQDTYDELCRLPYSLPLGNMAVDIDPDTLTPELREAIERGEICGDLHGDGSQIVV